MKLEVSYFSDTDTLWLSNGLPTPVGEDISENVIVFFDMEMSQPNGVLIEHAAESVLPVLQVEVESGQEKSKQPAQTHNVSPRNQQARLVTATKLQIDYHPESDTLWLGNGQPTPNGEDIAEYVTAFFDDEDQPNAVMIEHAAELLLPILQAAMQSSEESAENPAKPAKTS